MATEARLSRASSSLLTALGAFVFFALFLLAASLVPVVNVWVQTAVFFGSPFTWLLMQFKGSLPQAVEGYLLAAALYAPYPLLGALVGYLWPIKAGTASRAVLQIALRSVVVLVISFLGAVLIYFVVSRAPSL